MEDNRGAYFVSRRATGKSSRFRGSAGILIGVLLLLTGGICALVILLPKLSNAAPASSGGVYAGKTFYFLATGKSPDYVTGATFAVDAAQRGGAGYLYNDGTFNAIASVYERETDVKTLVELNENAFYFSLAIPNVSVENEDKIALDFFASDWFKTVDNAAAELDRGNTQESNADYVIKNAYRALYNKACACKSQKIRDALVSACEYDVTQANNRSVLSYIRFSEVRTVITVITALQA